MIELLWKYSQLVTLRIAQFFLIMMRALRAFGFKEKFKKNCASAGNVTNKLWSGFWEICTIREINEFSANAICLIGMLADPQTE